MEKFIKEYGPTVALAVAGSVVYRLTPEAGRPFLLPAFLMGAILVVLAVWLAYSVIVMPRAEARRQDNAAQLEAYEALWRDEDRLLERQIAVLRQRIDFHAKRENWDMANIATDALSEIEERQESGVVEQAREIIRLRLLSDV